MWPFTKMPPTDDIIAAFDPWVLCCAVGAENGSTGVRIGFDMWLRCSERNWINKVNTKLPGVSRNVIIKALRGYTHANRSRSYQDVLAEEERKRGLKPSIVLGPGETMTIITPLT